MSIITAKGKQAKESVNKGGGNIDFKKVFIKLKDNQSIKVRILSSEDYVEYMAHGSFNKGIFTQPCTKVIGEPCALCEASNYEGGEPDAYGKPEWNHIYAKKRYVFAFADIETGEIRVFDATKNQAKSIIGSIDEYADNVKEVMFTFKRVGSSKDTTYSLSPVLKMKPAEQESFDKFNDAVAEVSFFEAILQSRTREQQVKELKDCGFPVIEVFGEEGKAPSDEASTDPNNEASAVEGAVDPEVAF